MPRDRGLLPPPTERRRTCIYLSPLRRRQESAERGASAVEFALVTVILFPMLFGIIQYGIWFNDSLQVRQGIRQAARSGVVQGAPVTGCSSGDFYAKLKCTAKTQISPVTGAVAVMLKTPDSGGWKQGNRLIVCAEVQSAADSVGIVPVPQGGLIRAETQMSIEVDSPTVAGSLTPDTPLSGDWSWCK